MVAVVRKYSACVYVTPKVKKRIKQFTKKNDEPEGVIIERALDALKAAGK